MPDARQLALVRRHLRPSARVGEGGVLARHGATAMIDVSDGLALDLSRLARASGVGARLSMDDVPVAEGATIDDALGGGEDYELLAAVPDAADVEAARIELKEAFGVSLTDIGRVVDGTDLTTVRRDGTEYQLEPTGWDHFR
jgi:thiamine-monophosphate kinase